MQLRFTLIVVNSSQRDLPSQVCSHAGAHEKSHLTQLDQMAFVW